MCAAVVNVVQKITTPVIEYISTCMTDIFITKAFHDVRTPS